MSVFGARFFTAQDTPLTAPTSLPELTLIRQSDQVVVVNAQAMVNDGQGFYSYDLFNMVEGESYFASVDGDPNSDNTIFGERLQQGLFNADVEAVLADTAAMQPNIDEAVSAPKTLAANAVNAAAIATGAIDDDALAADLDTFTAEIWHSVTTPTGATATSASGRRTATS